MDSSTWFSSSLCHQWLLTYHQFFSTNQFQKVVSCNVAGCFSPEQKSQRVHDCFLTFKFQKYYVSNSGQLQLKKCFRSNDSCWYQSIETTNINLANVSKQLLQTLNTYVVIASLWIQLFHRIGLIFMKRFLRSF